MRLSMTFLAQSNSVAGLESGFVHITFPNDVMGRQAAFFMTNDAPIAIAQPNKPTPGAQAVSNAPAIINRSVKAA
jgi:thiamine pyrophosphate-dependent acetolactate synthase large subunit-like protein